MSLLYGAWTLTSADAAGAERDGIGRRFADWRCDRVGEMSSGTAAFGCRLTRQTAVEGAAAQPILDRDRNLMVMADIRIDNRTALLGALGLDPEPLSEAADSVLVHLAYRRWGKDCFRRLEGDFAIAIWDGAVGELILARDVVGVKPLAYALWADGAAFASSLPELYLCPPVSEELDEIELAAMFGFHPTGRERTFFAAIRWVRPGAWVRIGREGVAVETFATLGPAELSAAERRNPVPLLAELLEESVRCRLRGVGEVVCEMSGGFDSSIITLLAARQVASIGGRVHGLSWSPDPALFPVLEGDDERKRNQWIEGQTGIRCTYTPLAAVGGGDGETGHGSANELFRASWRERSLGLLGEPRLILSGWGGDEALSFYLRGTKPHGLFWGGVKVAWRRLRHYADGKRWTAAPRLLCQALLDWVRTCWTRRCFRRAKSSVINSALLPAWRVRLAETHGAEILDGATPQSVAACLAFLLDRQHVQERAAREQLDAARVGADMAYPMLDARLLRVVLALDPGWFEFGSERRPLLREVCRHLSLELPPNLSKLETAKERFETRVEFPAAPWRKQGTPAASDELVRLKARFLRADRVGLDHGPLSRRRDRRLEALLKFRSIKNDLKTVRGC